MMPKCVWKWLNNKRKTYLNKTGENGFYWKLWHYMKSLITDRYYSI